MIHLRFEEGCEPVYQSSGSAAADLRARTAATIPAGSVVKVPTGVWIDKVLWEEVPAQMIPELQVRARSGLAFKHGLTLANGIGTVDADYPEEICVLLWNSGKQDFFLAAGERLAQLVLNLVWRIPGLACQSAPRSGGFGSTGR